MESVDLIDDVNSHALSVEMEGSLDHWQWNGKSVGGWVVQIDGRLDLVGRYDVTDRSLARQTVLTGKEILASDQQTSTYNVAFNTGTSFCWNRTEVEGAFWVWAGWSDFTGTTTTHNPGSNVAHSYFLYLNCTCICM